MTGVTDAVLVGSAILLVGAVAVAVLAPRMPSEETSPDQATLPAGAAGDP